MTLLEDRADVLRERTWRVGDLAVELRWDDDSPATIGAVHIGARPTLVGGRPLVDLFTAEEQRARTSQSYIQSAVGQRLRVQSVQEDADDEGGAVLSITQRDDVASLEVTTTLRRPPAARALRVEHSVRNLGDAEVVLTAITSLVVGLGRAEADLDRMTVIGGESEWLAEGRWHERPLRDLVPRLSLGFHGQDGRGRYAVTSHGAWSTGEHIPVGGIVDAATGTSIMWQLEAGTAWQSSIGQGIEGGFLVLTGPADLEHQFAHLLPPGGVFRSVPAAIAFAVGGRDEAVAELSEYRRFQRGALREEDRAMPVVYNDFMNTLMGDPSTEKLLPLIEAAADAGVEYFCVDAGWFAAPGDYWDAIGEWVEHPDRFIGGFAAVIDAIERRGMRAGTWLEPECVGENSPAATRLPEEAFFRRFGRRVKEHGRYHLDFRHPAAVAHVDAAVDRLVTDYGISYLKLDYNINPGAGTELDAAAAGDGLLGHSRAFVRWLGDIQRRHPQLLIEHCSSGAMRMDYAYLQHCHLQSTSDQQDFRLYPPIAASAPLSVLPEQAGNWAYPSVEMTDAETVFTLVSGLAGRLYLSGFLDRLRPGQRDLVAEAVAVAKRWRTPLAAAHPFWPLGLPEWDAEAIVLGFHVGEQQLIVVWSRTAAGQRIRIPGRRDGLRTEFPARPSSADEWEVVLEADATVLMAPPGLSARVFRAPRLV
jgi:Alpha-galactosidase